MEAFIVIGMGYGDEGKGLTTDYLCSKLNNVVNIRFSGGQQAGHTVVKDGLEHTFSNFGAGTLRGAATYFTEHTTIYPVTIMREFEVMMKKGMEAPSLTIHPLARVTTPYDVFANRVDFENCYDGTCGLGIGKTMKRNEGPNKIYAVDLLNPKTLMEKVNNLKNYYGEFLDPTTGMLGFEDLIGFSLEMKEFRTAIFNLQYRIKGYEYLKNFDNLVFEGSQGVLLDMDHGVFPNVTYANTTSKNAQEVLDNLNCYNRHMFYVTRAYHSRHGAGTFKNEPIVLKNNETEHNQSNQFQGDFKVGKMDYDLLNHAFRVESIYSNSFKATSKSIVITCTDQIAEEDTFDTKRFEMFSIMDGVYVSASQDSKDLIKVFENVKIKSW